jgi:NSS family neurotransmitter:Na+ symporter
MGAQTSSPERGSWGTHLGFILAAVGSAVGLGNMWRFSYVAAEGGGGAFVLLYLTFVALLGIPVMTCELVVGRLTQVSPIKAVKDLGGPNWAPLGWLFVFCGFGILSYYSVIAGWTIRFAVDAVRGAIPTDTATYFNNVGTNAPAIVTHILFMGITIYIVVRGVKRGLEQTALILMPLLFFLLVGLAIWSSTLSGGGAGYAYYLKPRLSELLDTRIITDAAGQAFFSLSLGMGAMMTYASYLKNKKNLAKEAATIAVTDFGVAFVAGLVVFPIIFHFGLGEAIGLGGVLNTDNTVGTLFITLPPALETLGTVGDFIIATFFVMLFFAALTSAISMLEVVVSAVIDGWHWPRGSAALVFGALVTLAGLPSAMNLNFLAFVDKLVGTFLLMVGGLCTAILVGYRALPQTKAELQIGMDNEGLRDSWAAIVKYVVPPILVVVLFFGIKPVWAAFRALVGMQ